MTRKRAAVWMVVAVGAALIWASPLGNFIGLFVDLQIQSLFPSTISWDAKNAYLKCDGAIADARTWPAAPAAACEAMYLCANEAPLSDSQRQTLYQQIGKTPGCQAP